jgi:hypothetical protein
MKKILAFVAVSTLMATSAMADEPVMSKFKLSIGGFVKLDYAYNSENLGSQGALFPSSGGAPSKSITANANTATSATFANQEQSILTARESRLWFKVAGPDALGAKTAALIEGDFYGDNSVAADSPAFRMRHAYGTLDWTNTQILFGQYWDNFAPMVASTQDFRMGSPFGAPNTPRIPQFKLTQKVNLGAGNQIKLSVGAQDPSQFGNNTSGVTGVNTGTAGASTAGNSTTTGATALSGPGPNYFGQLTFTSKALGTAPGVLGMGMNPLTVTAFGLYGEDKDANSTGRRLDTYGTGIYAFVPVLKSSDNTSRAMTISFEGQVYEAANMAYNAATSLSVVGTGATQIALTNTAAGTPTEARYWGTALQLMFYPTQELGLVAGYGRRDALKPSDFTGISNFQKSTAQAYFNVSYDLNAAVRVAAEYQNATTVYGNLNGTADSTASGAVNIGRLCAYYFF